MPQGLQDYGSGFLTGLTNVAKQARSDKREQEDLDIRNKMAMAQLAVTSGDPELIRTAIAGLNEVFGVKTKGGKGGAAAGADPQSMIAELLIGGIGRGREAQAPGQPPAGAQPGATPTQPGAASFPGLGGLELDPSEIPQPPSAAPTGAGPAADTGAPFSGFQVETPEQKTQRALAEQQTLDEAAVARIRANVPPDRQEAAILQYFDVPAVERTTLGPGGTLVEDGEPQFTTPFRPAAPANMSRLHGILEGEDRSQARDFFYSAQDPSQMFDRTAEGLVPVGRIIAVPEDPTIAASRAATLTRTQQQIATGERTEQAAAAASTAQENYDAIPADYRTLLDAAMARLPAAAQTSKRALAVERWATTQATNDPADLQRLIRNTVFESATDPNTRRQVEGREASIQELTEIRVLLNELATDSVNADGTVSKGITTGRWVGTAERGLRWAGRSRDPRLTRLTARINATVIAYRSAVSGAAFTESEGEAYEALFPSIGNTSELNMALIDSTQEAMRSVNQTFWNGRLGPTGAALIGAADGDGARRLKARQVLMDAQRAADPDAVDRFLQNNPDFR